MDVNDAVADDETMDENAEEAQITQQVDSNEQGHDKNLFCQLHIVSFWDGEKMAAHNYHMHPLEGMPHMTLSHCLRHSVHWTAFHNMILTWRAMILRTLQN